MTEQRYRLILNRAAKRAVSGKLPEGVATAVLNFITGDLLDNPRRVGKPLHNEYEGAYGARRGTYRVIYIIDDETSTVTIIRIDHRTDHRSDVYRSSAAP